MIMAMRKTVSPVSSSLSTADASRRKKGKVLKKMYKYYLLYGICPSKNLQEVHNYNDRRYEPAVKREVWGYVEYSEPLTEEEMKDYGLMEG